MNRRMGVLARLRPRPPETAETAETAILRLFDTSVTTRRITVCSAKV